MPFQRETKSSASIDQGLAIAARAKDLGTTIIVTNPWPIRWGGSEDKSDPQLKHQAKSLDRHQPKETCELSIRP
jgi:inosose dehydratase